MLQVFQIRGNLDKIQKNSSFFSGDLPVLHGHHWKISLRTKSSRGKLTLINGLLLLVKTCIVVISLWKTKRKGGHSYWSVDDCCGENFELLWYFCKAHIDVKMCERGGWDLLKARCGLSLPLKTFGFIPWGFCVSLPIVPTRINFQYQRIKSNNGF